MAFSLLSLLDDVVSLLDDVSVMTKVAVKKTSGVIGDDLALNAESLSGLNPDKELPIIYTVGKGSLVNKVILVPLALLLSSYLPSLITPLLFLGGLYLCYEGSEKVLEKIFGSTHKEQAIISEEQKIKGAIRTDFVLSAEIIIIALGSIQEHNILTKSIVLSVIAFFMTIFIYGMVAILVKLDDLGLKIMKRYQNQVAQKTGYALVVSVPYIMKTLAVVGTIAMFSVGGGIIAHSLIPLHIPDTSYLEGIVNIVIGVLTGLSVLCCFKIIKKIKKII